MVPASSVAAPTLLRTTTTPTPTTTTDRASSAVAPTLQRRITILRRTMTTGLALRLAAPILVRTITMQGTPQKMVLASSLAAQTHRRRTTFLTPTTTTVHVSSSHVLPVLARSTPTTTEKLVLQICWTSWWRSASNASDCIQRLGRDFEASAPLGRRFSFGLSHLT